MIIYIKNNPTFHTSYKKLQNSMHKYTVEHDLKAIFSYVCRADNDVTVRAPVAIKKVKIIFVNNSIILINTLNFFYINKMVKFFQVNNYIHIF